MWKVSRGPGSQEEFCTASRPRGPALGRNACTGARTELKVHGRLHRSRRRVWRQRLRVLSRQRCLCTDALGPTGASETSLRPGRVLASSAHRFSGSKGPPGVLGTHEVTHRQASKARATGRGMAEAKRCELVFSDGVQPDATPRRACEWPRCEGCHHPPPARHRGPRICPSPPPSSTSKWPDLGQKSNPGF